METVTVTMSKDRAEWLKRKLAIDIRSAQVRLKFAETDVPRDSERAEKQRTHVEDLKREIAAVFPEFEWKKERFTMDSMYQLYCDDYPDSEDEEY